jgi:hypothetical protein
VSRAVRPKTLREERKTYEAPWVTAASKRLGGQGDADPASSESAGSQQEPTPATASELPSAAAAFLRADIRNRKVVLEELLRDFALGDSDAARCVRLAAAKLAYESLYPDTAHGKNQGKRDPKSGSIPFWKYAVAKLGGWKRATILRWCAIGEGLRQDAYASLLGTSLANDLGRLEVLARLPEQAQVNVATKFQQNLNREGRDLLERLSRRPEDAAVPDEEAPARPVVDGPPCDRKELEVTPPGFCVLDDHVIGIIRVGENIRLTSLGYVRPENRPNVVAAEDWYDVVVRAAGTFASGGAISGRAHRVQGRYQAEAIPWAVTWEAGSYTIEVSPIAWVAPGTKAPGSHPRIPTLPAHHLVTVTCRPAQPLGANADLVVYVARWESADASPTSFGEGYLYDPYRKKLPVLTVSPEPPAMVTPHSPVPYDWALSIEKAVVEKLQAQLVSQRVGPAIERHALYTEQRRTRLRRAVLRLLNARAERVREHELLFEREAVAHHVDPLASEAEGDPCMACGHDMEEHNFVSDDWSEQARPGCDQCDCEEFEPDMAPLFKALRRGGFDDLLRPEEARDRDAAAFRGSQNDRE